MAWWFLSLAIVLEITGTFLLKLSDGFEKWHWGVLSILCYALCFWALAPALKVLPVGLAYAIWAGVGVIGASALGYLVFGDDLSWFQYLFILMILIGAVGLRFTARG
ncbi:MAG: multidrug efflux SMR transporter [Pseudomonadota bacterium]